MKTVFLDDRRFLLFRCLFGWLEIRVCAALALACGLGLGCTRHETLFIYESTDGGQRATSVRPGVLQPGKQTRVKFELPDTGETIRVVLEPRKGIRLPDGQHAWSGELEGGKSALFLQIGGVLEAQIPIGSRIYRVHGRAPEAAVWEIIEARELHHEAQQFHQEPAGTAVPRTPEAGETVDAGIEADGGALADASIVSDPFCGKATSTIDVMILYTEAAAKAAAEPEPPPVDGVIPIENEIAFGIAGANDALANSALALQLNLVYAGVAPEFSEAEHNDVEPNDELVKLLEDLRAIPSGEEAVADNPGLVRLHDLREDHKADVVSLIVELQIDEADKFKFDCGIGDPWIQGNRYQSFSVVRRRCATERLSIAHEVGHNLGGAHQCGYAQADPEPPRRTVMSIDTRCDPDDPTKLCHRIPRFSSSDDFPSSDKCDNTSHLQQVGSTVGGFWCGEPTGPGDVFIRDNWGDRGCEPGEAAAEPGGPETEICDPTTEPAWGSPSIWVRNTKSADGQRSLGYQSPKADQPNFVYVKLENRGGQAETGRLRAYVKTTGTAGDASAGWTEIDTTQGAVEITVPAAGHKIVSFEWIGAPADGTQEFLARWEKKPNDSGVYTDLDPTAQDLQEQVLASNDLAWLKTRIIEPQLIEQNTPVAVVFAMPADSVSEETDLLIVARPLSRAKVNWDRLVDLSVMIPEAFQAGLTRTLEPDPPASGHGFVAYKVALTRGVQSVGPFKLTGNARARIELRIGVDNPDGVKALSRRLRNAVYYEIMVLQIRPAGIALANNPGALFEQGLVASGTTFLLRISGKR